MTLPAVTAEQVCLLGPADGFTFDDIYATAPPTQFIAAVHHGKLCCGADYEDAEGHDDDEVCDCMPPSRGLYALDLDRSIANGTQWVYVYDREVQ
ncbi:hypothetical protein ABIB45_001345 [Arthrobacter sp. UYCo732]